MMEPTAGKYPGKIRTAAMKIAKPMTRRPISNATYLFIVVLLPHPIKAAFSYFVNRVSRLVSFKFRPIKGIYLQRLQPLKKEGYYSRHPSPIKKSLS